MKWGPYLKVLAIRPMALKYSGFYDMLGGELKEFLGGLELKERKEIMESVARFSETRDLSDVINGMEKAISMAHEDSDSFISALGFHLNISGHVPKNKVPEGFEALKGYRLDFKEYSALLPKKVLGGAL